MKLALYYGKWGEKSSTIEIKKIRYGSIDVNGDICLQVEVDGTARGIRDITCERFILHD